jgi:hypothetical protein
MHLTNLIQGGNSMSDKVYTSGVLSNNDSGIGVQLAQDLFVSVTNFGDRPVSVKVEVFNWGEPITSAQPPGTPTTPIAVTVIPGEEIQIPAGTTQHFYANINLVPSFEVRVTIRHSKHSQGQVVFNAVSVDESEDDVEHQVLFKDFVLLKDDIDDKNDQDDKDDKDDKKKKHCDDHDHGHKSKKKVICCVETDHPDKDWYC